MVYIFIVNGRKDKGHILDEVVSQLTAISPLPKYDIYITKCRKDAISFVEQTCADRLDESICFVSCGGDGTLCEVVTGYMNAYNKSLVQNKYIAVLPLGTGNDFIRYYPDRNFKSIQTIFTAIPQNIDIIKVNDMYSINIINVGFDAKAGYIGGKLSSKGIFKPYIHGVIIAALFGRFNKIRIDVNGERIGGKRMLLCTIANSRYVGEGMLCAPRASNNDGLIDICYIKTMTLLKAIRILFAYIAGTHLDNPKFSDKIIYRQVSDNITISSHRTTKVLLDGEPLSGDRFNVSIIPNAVKFLIPTRQIN